MVFHEYASKCPTCGWVSYTFAPKSTIPHMLMRSGSRRRQRTCTTIGNGGERRVEARAEPMNWGGRGEPNIDFRRFSSCLTSEEAARRPGSGFVAKMRPRTSLRDGLSPSRNLNTRLVFPIYLNFDSSVAHFHSWDLNKPSCCQSWSIGENVEVLCDSVLALANVMELAFDAEQFRGVVSGRICIADSLPDFLGRRVEKGVLPDIKNQWIDEPRHKHVVLGVLGLEFAISRCWTFGGVR